MAVEKRMLTGGGVEFTCGAVSDNTAEISAQIEGLLEAADCSPRAMAQLLVALDEILTNIVTYAYPEAEGDVSVAAKIDGGIAEITFSDSGIPYNPLTHSDPDTTLSAQERDIGGLGILLVKKTMDEVRYEHTNGKNVFTVKKKI